MCGVIGLILSRIFWSVGRGASVIAVCPLSDNCLSSSRCHWEVIGNEKLHEWSTCGYWKVEGNGILHESGTCGHKDVIGNEILHESSTCGHWKSYR